MSKTEKLNEEQVFKQALDDDELEGVAGGLFYPVDDDTTHCVNNFERNIYEGGFPNCAATVEDGSQCETNDACMLEAVRYQGRKSCIKVYE